MCLMLYLIFIKTLTCVEFNLHFLSLFNSSHLHIKLNPSFFIKISFSVGLVSRTNALSRASINAVTPSFSSGRINIEPSGYFVISILYPCIGKPNTFQPSRKNNTNNGKPIIGTVGQDQNRPNMNNKSSTNQYTNPTLIMIFLSFLDIYCKLDVR